MLVVLDVKDLDVEVEVVIACAQCLLVVLLLVLFLLLLVDVELFHLRVHLLLYSKSLLLRTHCCSVSIVVVLLRARHLCLENH